MHLQALFRLRLLLIAGLAAWLLVACGAPAAAPPPLPTVVAPTATPIAEAPTAAPDAAPVDAAAENIRQLLARQLQVDPAAVTLVSDETVEWTDSCLGAGLPNESCAQVITPGHKLTFQVDGQEYVIHSDRDGYQTRVAAAPAPAIGEMLLAWGGTFDNGECMEAIMGTTGVSFARCGGQNPIGGKFVTPARQAVLNGWIAAYAPFDAETDFGSIRLVGTGTAVATPEEQATIGRWAQLVAMEAAAGQRLAGMSYQGPAEMGSADTAKCATLQLGAAGEVGLGACDGTMQTLPIYERMAAEWLALSDRFAPFVYETATERLTFEGMGSERGEAWQRAILAWARARYAELATGQTSATINTAMSWHLGQDFSQKNVCLHLTVLDYGYAYAEQILCEGGDLIDQTGDWLTGEELAQLDGWLYNRAAFTLANNYINGQGTEPLNEADQVAVNDWATALYQRLRGTGPAVAPAADGATCPEAQPGLATVRNYQQGFCLLVPADYTVFDTAPNEIALVRDSLMNVTDPRLHIAVTAAEGRTAEQLADELLAELTGFEIERSTTEVAGQPAVVLTNMPGQDLNRRVLIALNDRLYDLTFMPLSSPDLENFYTTILTYFVLVQPE